MDFISRKPPEQQPGGPRQATPDQKPVSSQPIATTLGEDTEFDGTLKFGKSLRIDGKFQGDLSSTGHLYIGRAGQVRAEVKVGSVTIEGKLTGNINASGLVDLRSAAEVFGNIAAAKIKIEEGVILEGQIKVQSNESKSRPLDDDLVPDRSKIMPEKEQRPGKGG